MPSLPLLIVRLSCKLSRNLDHGLPIHPHPSHRCFEQLFEAHKGFMSVGFISGHSSLIKYHPSDTVECHFPSTMPGTAGVGKSKTETLFHGACCVNHRARTSGDEVRMLSCALGNSRSRSLGNFQTWLPWRLLPPHQLGLLDFLLPSHGHLIPSV